MRRKAAKCVITLAMVIAGPTAGQTAARFEAASVRISKPGAERTAWSDPGSGAFRATNIPLRILFQMAYAVDEKQISGEGLLGSEEYDVVAKPEGGGKLTSGQLQPMLASLLVERFGLVTHRETRSVSGYAFVNGKEGPKLRASEASTSGKSATFPGRIIGRGADMVVLASMLGRPLGAPVTDHSGIKGAYDFDLNFAPPESADSSLPSIFTAIQEQLGLKLEARKVPLQMLVIDKCRRTPSEN